MFGDGLERLRYDVEVPLLALAAWTLVFLYSRAARHRSWLRSASPQNVAMTSLSVVIPAFNEQDQIVATVEAVAGRLRERGGGWEILVVDNASEDATVARITPLLGDSRIRLLRNERNFGKGYSVRRGMLESGGERRLLCDADCTASLASLTRMEALLDRADVVAGSRNSDGAAVERYQPLHRRAVSIVFILLCRLLMSEPLSDVFCGWSCLTADAAADAFGPAEVDGLEF